MPRNALDKIRPQSRFNTFVSETEQQLHVCQTMQAVAHELASLETTFNGMSGRGYSTPFGDGSLMVLSGGTGRGKTHLLEALANELIEKAPKTASNVFLVKGSDLGAELAIHKQSDSAFDRKPIVFVDDFLSDNGSISELSGYEKTQVMDLMTNLYENRRLAIVTTNFPILEQLIPAIAAVDPVGRAVSRSKELIGANGFELILDGGDYREKLAQQKQRTGFKLSIGRS